MNTNDLAKAIHPGIKPSFSPNLHKWVAAWGRRLPQHIPPEIWVENSTGRLYIGYIDHDHAGSKNPCGFIGSILQEVLCTGTKATKGWFANLGPGNMTKAADFWERYQAIGRCAIDTGHRRHFINDDERYQMQGDLRTCTWCGAQHRRRIEIKVIEQKVEHFDIVAQETPA